MNWIIATDEERRRRDRQILFDYMSGVSPKALTAKYGFRSKQIYKILRSQGIESHKKKTAEKDRRILDLHRKGMSRPEIAAELGISKDGVRYTLRKNGYNWTPKLAECQFCGMTFMEKQKGQRFCSPECRAEAAALRRKADTGIWKKCESCGKPYKAKSAGRYKRKFCTRSCSAGRRAKKNEARDREIFYLRDVQGLTFKRIGEIFDIATGTAHKRYHQQKRIKAEKYGV